MEPFVRFDGRVYVPRIAENPKVEALEVVPRSEAEALAEALEAHRTAIVMSVRNEYDVADADETLWAALAAYRARHPKEETP
jgi:hypothetical protein